MRSAEPCPIDSGSTSRGGRTVAPFPASASVQESSPTATFHLPAAPPRPWPRLRTWWPWQPCAGSVRGPMKLSGTICGGDAAEPQLAKHPIRISTPAGKQSKPSAGPGMTTSQGTDAASAHTRAPASSPANFATLEPVPPLQPCATSPSFSGDSHALPRRRSIWSPVSGRAHSSCDEGRPPKRLVRWAQVRRREPPTQRSWWRWTPSSLLTCPTRAAIREAG